VRGQKTDQKDAEWIAQLLQHGLLRPSYVPCEIIRDLGLTEEVERRTDFTLISQRGLLVKIRLLLK
jgi:hypothetical protein